MIISTKKLQKRGAKWSSLRVFGNSRIVRSSYFWFILIPMISKFFNYCDKDGNRDLFFCKPFIEIEIPFNWKIAFYGSLFYALATLLYQLFCPHVVKNYQNYSEFSKSGRGIGYLIWCLTTRYGNSFQSMHPNVAAYLETFGLKKNMLDGRHYDVIAQEIHMLDQDMPTFFWYVVERLDFYKLYIRQAVLLLYTIGSLFFIWVILENLYAVLSYIGRQGVF